jgi:Crp-like helix-turn-helix protein
MALRWLGYCHGCRRVDREIQTRYEHAAKTLCDACAGLNRRERRHPPKPPGTPKPRKPSRAVQRALDRALDQAHLERAGRAATDQRLDVMEALVLGAQHQFAMTKRICWPNQQTIADLIGARREDVNRACFRLAERGLISWTKRWSPRIRHLHNVYELHGRWHPSHRRPLLRWLDRRRANHTKRPATGYEGKESATKYRKADGSQGWQDQRCVERRSGSENLMTLGRPKCRRRARAPRPCTHGPCAGWWCHERRAVPVLRRGG